MKRDLRNKFSSYQYNLLDKTQKSVNANTEAGSHKKHQNIVFRSTKAFSNAKSRSNQSKFSITSKAISQALSRKSKRMNVDKLLSLQEKAIDRQRNIYLTQ